MKTVWKGILKVDALSVSSTQLVRMPAESNLVHIAEQSGQIGLWFEVWDDKVMPIEERKFQIFGTGTGPIGPHLIYRGSVLMYEGSLVLHVYEVVE